MLPSEDRILKPRNGLPRMDNFVQPVVQVWNELRAASTCNVMSAPLTSVMNVVKNCIRPTMGHIIVGQKTEEKSINSDERVVSVTFLVVRLYDKA